MLKVFLKTLLLIVGLSIASSLFYEQQARSSATQQPSPQQTAIARGLTGEVDVIRIDANLVTVPAMVMDRNGRYVTDLRKEEFQIFENGISQEVAFLQTVEQPFTIFLLIDVSPSMLPHQLELARAVDAFVAQLRPKDRVIAASFFQWVHELVAMTKVSEWRNGLRLKVRDDAGGDCPGTYLYDAVHEALKRTKTVPGRKAMVLFTDGVGMEHAHTAKENLRAAEEQDALIYTVQFGTHDIQAPRNVSKERYLEWIDRVDGYMLSLAQKSGGRAYKMENGMESVDRTAQMVGEELRRQYTLGYYPKAALKVGERRQIKVNVTRPDLATRSRESYVVARDRLPGSISPE